MRFRAAQVDSSRCGIARTCANRPDDHRETATTPRTRDRYANKQLFEPPSQFTATSEPGQGGALDKSDEIAAGQTTRLGTPSTAAAASETRSKLEESTGAFAGPVAPAKTAQAEVAAKDIPAAKRKLMNYAAEPNSRKRLLRS